MVDCEKIDPEVCLSTDCEICEKLYGGSCTDLQQKEEADVPGAADPEAIFIIRLTVMALKEGPSRPPSEVWIDNSYGLAGGTTTECYHIIKESLAEINRTGFLTVPLNGTVIALPKEILTRIDFTLEEA